MLNVLQIPSCIDDEDALPTLNHIYRIEEFSGLDQLERFRPRLRARV